MKTKLAACLISAINIAGCTNLTQVTRFNENTPLNPQKATIVGLVSEGFIDTPQGLSVLIKQQNSKTPYTVKLETLGIPDEDLTPNVLGNTFVFQVPLGSYRITQWSFAKDRTANPSAPKPLTFNVNAGEVAYIGNLRSNELTLCLSNQDDYEYAIKDIKFAHPLLDKINIINKSSTLTFDNWAHANAKDITGSGLCRLF